jgi:hypothetical protein
MAAVDGSLNDPTPTSEVADRLDVWKVARRTLSDSGMLADAKPADVLELAQWLAGEDF